MTLYMTVGHETTRVDYLHVYFIFWMGIGEMITVESGQLDVTN